MRIRDIIIICASLLFIGCEDLNTFCPTDNNDTNSSDSNITCPDCNNTCPDYNLTCPDCPDCNLTCPDCPDKEEDEDEDNDDKDSNTTKIARNTIASDSQECNLANSNSCPSSNTCPDSNSNACPSSNTCPDSNSNACPESDSNSCPKSDSESKSNPSPDSDSNSDENLVYYLHTNIKTTLFWIGEKNKIVSDWDNDWMMHYGGIDIPDQRVEYYPITFTPDENPFYAALPYNDLDNNGEPKPNIEKYIPWATDNDNHGLSICKNRWIKISAHRKSAYAQWEDAGPIGSSDINYVFGNSEPLGSDFTAMAVSPAVYDYLGLDENDTVAWKFVDFSQVPDGPWRDIITTSMSN